METNPESAFITIEGIEGVGKSTAIHFLENYFQQFQSDYILTREPGGTKIAEAIRQVVLQPFDEKMMPDTELLLMFASRAQHIATVILPALMAGKIVISDRFTDATYAYQGGGRQLNTHRIALLEQWVQNTLQPDLTILLDAPIEVGLQRILSRSVKDRIEHEQIDFFHRVRQMYLKRAEEFPNRFKIVDATLSVEKVQDQLRTIISALLVKKGLLKEMT